MYEGSTKRLYTQIILLMLPEHKIGIFIIWNLTAMAEDESQQRNNRRWSIKPAGTNNII